MPCVKVFWPWPGMWLVLASNSPSLAMGLWPWPSSSTSLLQDGSVWYCWNSTMYLWNKTKMNESHPLRWEWCVSDWAVSFMYNFFGR
jgi:hypothetical protein